MTVYDYGVDLNSNLSFTDGDIVLSEYNDNIAQAICNRLNTIIDSLDLFYEGYGSVLLYYLGWKRVDKTLKYIKLEVESCLKQDPRINQFTVEADFTDTGGVRIDLRLFYDYEVVETNLVLDSTGVNLVEDDEEEE